MKRLASASFFATASVVAVVMLVVPSAFGAARTQTPGTDDGTNCNYALTEPNATVVSGSNPQLVVYGGAGGGVSGTTTHVVGVCLDTNSGSGFEGGTLEVGVGDPKRTDGGHTGFYAVADGDDDNTTGGQSAGYIGLSNYETGASSEGCQNDGKDTGPKSTNSGGCLQIRDLSQNPVAAFPVPLLACGNTTGTQFEHSTRDGCTII